MSALLELRLRDLPAAAQLVYLRLAWWAGLQTGPVASTVDRLIATTGLSRNTVRQALRYLTQQGLVRVHTSRRRYPTVWWVSVPQVASEAPVVPREDGWLVDRLDPEDLDTAWALVHALTPVARRALEAEAEALYGPLSPQDLEKAVADILVRRNFGPARLARYSVKK